MTNKEPSELLLKTLSQHQSDSSKVLSEIIKEFEELLSKEDVDKLSLERAIVVHIPYKGTIVNVPALQKKPLTKKDLKTAVHIVGVIVTTRSMKDPLSENSIPPGSYAVRLVPKPAGYFAFDLLDKEGRINISVPATVRDLEEFARTEDNETLGGLVDVIIDQGSAELNGLPTCLSFVGNVWWCPVVL